MIVCFEGINGAGKSTQMSIVQGLINNKYPGRRVTALLDPGVYQSHPAFVRIRPLAVDEVWQHRMTRPFLFAAARCELIHEARAASDAGHIVLLDRFVLSYYAYQYGDFAQGGGSDELSADALSTMQSIVRMSDSFTPDLTILLDVPPLLAMHRVRDIGRFDVFERADIKDVEALRSRYLRMAFMDLVGVGPVRVIATDDCHHRAEVGNMVWKEMVSALGSGFARA